jgi:regulator of protease activity HflC (stomatin/prohibitin superfamily)
MVLLATACTNPETPAGHEGYVFERPRVMGKGGFRGIVTGPGNYGVSVFRNQVINIDLRPKTYTEQFEILAKDDLNISFQFHAIIGLAEGRVEDVVVKYGAEQWYARFVREPFRTFVRNAVQRYDSRQVKANREIVAGQVQEELQRHLEATPFQLVSLVVGNIDYPEIVAKAVEAKLAAQQFLEEKETQKLIAQRDAEIRIEEAKGIAEAQKIINATLTPNYLQHEAIRAQEQMAASPNHTTVYIPVGTNGLPLVHMPKN